MDTKRITDALTTAERLRNNLVTILGVIGSIVLVVSNAARGIDFTSIDTLWASVPAVMAKLGSLQAFGPVTVEKLRDARKL